jgi:hypothetical protein
MAQTSGVAETGGANPALGQGTGADAVMQPALNPTNTDASGNPGGNAPGAGRDADASAGVGLGTGVDRGTMVADNLQNAPPSTAMAAGGMAGTGLVGQPPTAEDEAARILGDPDSPALGSAPTNTRDDAPHFESASRDIDAGAGVGQAVSGPSVGGFGANTGGRISDATGSSR